MPILDRELDLYPANLLDQQVDETVGKWFAMYTLARYEKKLMRQLHDRQIAFYAPVIARRYRAPNGRVRVTHMPLFSNYVFVWGSEEARYTAVSTGSVSRCVPVLEGERLRSDLLQIKKLIDTGAPITPEDRLSVGDKVRVKTGSFAGFYGIVTKRQGETKLLVYVDFMGQGASVNLDDCQLEIV